MRRRSSFPSRNAAERAGKFAMAVLHRSASAREWCSQNGVRIERAQAVTVDSLGGFLVPSELSMAIIDNRDRYGAFRRGAQVEPMASEIQLITKRGSGLTTRFFGEGQTITESQVEIGQVQLVAQKAGALVRASSEVDEDSAVEFGEFIAVEFGHALAVMEDSCGFNGDATSTYGGTYGLRPALIDGAHDASRVVAATGHNTFAEIDADDLANLMALLPEWAYPGAAWYCSAYAYAQTFCRAEIAAGGLTASIVDGEIVAFFKGFPVILTPVMPGAGNHDGTVMLLFGYLERAAILGERKGLEIERGEHVFFATDEVAYKGKERIDIVNHGLGDNDTAGAMVGLVGG